ncbi:MAG: hypothetical protein IPF64_17615 [Flavobacteriales bacterium]|nr:hypothetical protein [Flavobacteriales bacterium]
MLQPGSSVNDPLMLSMSMASCGDLVFYQATYDYALARSLYALYQPSVGIAEQAHPIATACIRTPLRTNCS